VPNEFIYINVLRSQAELDITNLVTAATGFDGSELKIFDGLFNNCFFLKFNANRLFLYRTKTETICSSLFLPYTVCGQNVGVTINTTFEEIITCFTNTIDLVTFENNLHTINGSILSETYLEYSLDNLVWNRVSGTFPVGNSIVTSLLPQVNMFLRLVSVCNESFVSNVIFFDQSVNQLFLMGGINQDSPCLNIGSIDCYFQLQDYSVFQVGDLVFSNGRARLPFIGGNLNYNVFLSFGYSANVTINNQGVITAINFVC
jgi:hypothetical protein